MHMHAMAELSSGAWIELCEYLQEMQKAVPFPGRLTGSQKSLRIIPCTSVQIF